MIKQLLLFFSLFLITSLHAQQVSTLLSNGSNLDDCVFLSSKGILYTSDFVGGKFGKLENGVHTIIADTLINSNGITEDEAGNIYVAEYGRGRVLRYDSSEQLTVFCQGFHNPSGIIKMYNSDTLIVTSYTRDSLYKIAPDGNVIPYLGGSLFDGPVGLAYDTLNNLYVGNFDGMEILKITPDKQITVHCTLPGQQQGFLAYAGGYLYGTVLVNHQIYKIALDTMDQFTLFSGAGSGYVDGHADTAKYYRPNGICASRTGDTLYVSEYNVERLRMITGVLHPESIPVDGVAQLQLTTMRVYPVPAERFVTITGTTALQHLIIIDLLGTVVEEVDVWPKHPLTLDISHYAKGMYRCVGQTTGGAIVQTTFIKY